MIAASEPQEFIPFGRQQVVDHPGAIQIGLQQQQHQSETVLLNRLSQVSISESHKKTESWLLRETINDNIEYEEELYYTGKTVIWSIGPALTDNKNNRILKCCYTNETPVREALWCSFHLSKPEISSMYLRENEKIKVIDLGQKNSKKNEELKNCICIMDTNSIKFYAKSGKEYFTALQFKVSKIWPIKYGIILERDLEKKDTFDGVSEPESIKIDLPPSSPQSCMSFRNISLGVQKPSFEQSYILNPKSFAELGEKSTFGSTHYMNLPPNVHESFSPVNFALSGATPTLDNESALPVVFSLSHPLDEICPVVVKDDTLSYISNPEVKIVFTSEEPSLCMIYNKKTKTHSIYFVRKAQQQESEICLHRESMLSRTCRTHHQSFSTTGKPCFSNSASSSFNLHVGTGNLSLPAFLSAKTRKSLGLSHNIFPNVINSPFTPLERARHSSPIPSRNTLSPAFGHNFYTPSPRRSDTSINSPYGGTPSRIESRMMTEDIEYAEPKPLYPQICIQHLWTETVGQDNSDISLQAEKAFLTKDLCEQFYICYLIKIKSLLTFVKFKKNNNDNSLIFCEKCAINAKDACALTSLDMIAIIGLDGGVELYSGITRVAKILISGVPSCIATSSYLSDSNAGPTFFKHMSLSAFPKRSSLLPQSVLSHSNHSPVFNDSLSQLSPVTTFESSCYDKLTPNISITNSNVTSPHEGTLVALKDSVSSRISMEFSTGMLFRMELPNFGNSPLVKSCLNSLRHVLPNELFMKVSVKWYCTRNVPGCHGIDTEEEWSMFTDVLFDLMGYDVELLKGTKADVERSPVIRAKKQKKCEKSGDEDWSYLISSKHHEVCLNQTGNILGLGQATETDIQADFDVSCGITETPSIPSRSSLERYDSLDSVRTPVDKSRFHSSKFKSSSSKLQEKSSLESIEETPLQPKASFSKSKFTTNRFKICLDQGDISPIMPAETPQKVFDDIIYLNVKSPLNPYISWVLFALHLLYEDMKLNHLKKKFLPTLAKFLHRLSSDLKLTDYIHHYWTDFPGKCPFAVPKYTGEIHIDRNFPPCFQKQPPNIFQHFYNMLLKKNVNPYPYIFKVNTRTKDLIQIFGLLSYGYENPGISMETLVKQINFNKLEKVVDKGKSSRPRSHRPIPHRVIQLMIQMGITQDSMQTLPPGVSLILYEALYSCRDYPGFGWSKEAYKLAMRHDLTSFCRQNSKEEVGPTNELIMPTAISNSKNSSTIRLNMDLEEDGMEDLTNMDVLKLRFSTDQRVLEARRMLQSAQPVRITIQQRPDVSDHEFIQEQEKHLYAICLRTMALPVGRGMMTVRSANPVITEKLPIPPLCLTGRVPPTDKVVDMSHIEVASNMNVWPLFHNGVAAGLRISPNAMDIDSQWIIYNKPKTNNEELIEHAGFLMALGLNGHLSNLQDTSIFHYLIKFHEMTSVGLLLGIAASKRGTMDTYMVRIVSLHIEAMLPPTGIEIDVDVVVEPAALVSLGFLYQGTAHRHIAQVLLQEIGRPPGPEMANSVDRESYSLAAGLALGLVVFGRGAKLSGLGDMAIADTLHHYMVGGPKRPYLGSQREKYRTPSFLIWEGDLVNTHVTGPGAVLALGMLYFNTGNKAIAEWLKAPETQHLLEVVLPDALLLRTLAKGLILWDEVEPTESWVMSHVPEFIRPYVLVKPEMNNEKCIDYETIDQAYCNILAGACMAIGLRFAGSACEEAFETLFMYTKMFTSLLGKNIGELCGRSTIETCLNVVTVSLAMVMAGTGDIEVLRLCRYLRSRVGPTNAVVTYGSHLATHMAIGLLFLGGGAYTLSTSPDAIAALLCAFYPKWPIHSNDNRYHLQAFRHLYVLAIESRLLLPRDIDTRTLCYAHITCVYLDTSASKEKEIKLRAPCLLPELNKLKEVRIDDNRYWSIVFTRDKNWEDFTNILAECSFVDVKQKAGCLSYLEDPQGFRSLLAQTLTRDDVIPWTIRVETIFGFSSDPILVNFTQYFLEGRENDESENAEEKMVVWLTYIAYYCLTKDKLSLLPIWMSLLKAGQNIFFNASSIEVWQLKLMWTQALRSSGSNNSSPLIPPDTVLSTKQYCQKCFESWEPDIKGLLQDYIRNTLDPNSKDQDKLTAYLTFHDIPRLDGINETKGKQKIIQELTDRGLSASAVMKIAAILENYQ